MKENVSGCFFPEHSVVMYANSANMLVALCSYALIYYIM